MKHKFYHSLLAGLALLTATVACSPDNEVLPAPDLTPADLVEGKAYRVTVDQTTNKVTMTSLLGNGYITSWSHPQGLERGESAEANIPFAGDYEIKFGVMTRGGMVYGEPYRFTLNTTNGDLLTDPLWTYLTGGPDQTKTWVLDENLYDLGSFTFMCHYMGWDKFTEGKKFTEADCPEYKDEYGYDSPDWVWGAGHEPWCLGLNTKEELQAVPELTFDLINGANLTVDGVTKSFVMDPARKTITMPEGLNWLGDMVGSSFISDMVNLELVKLNEHVLGLKVNRANDNQRFVICYVEKGWDGTWPVTGPSLTTAPVTLPTYEDLITTLFTIEGDDATYLGTANTFLLDADMPYGFKEWDGTYKNNEGALTGKWVWLPLYGTSACPPYTSTDEFSMVIKKGKDVDGDLKPIDIYTAEIEGAEGISRTNFVVEGNKIIFDKDVTILSAEANLIRSKEFVVFECDPASGKLEIGIPAEYNELGVATRYLCANMNVKPIGGGQTGPVNIPVDQQYLNNYIEGKHHYRIEVYNAYYDEDGLYPVDVSKLKLKKGQTMKVSFRLPGVTWADGASPRVTFAHNFDDLGGFNWDTTNSAIFTSNPTVTLNKDGVTEVTLTNTTSGTLKFEGKSCITICIEQAGLVVSPLDAQGNLDASQIQPQDVTLTIE